LPKPRDKPRRRQAASHPAEFGRITGTRPDYPLSDGAIMHVARSIFAESKHEGWSEKYICIPTRDLLNSLRPEGLQPFTVCQARVRQIAWREHTWHRIRLRHADQINGREANEIILINTHDGISSYGQTPLRVVLNLPQCI
jgi:hypothetical protein